MRHVKTMEMSLFQERNSRITEEHILRELAKSLVNDIDLEELKKLINFTVLHPMAAHFQDKLLSKNTTGNEKDFLRRLQQRGIVFYKAEIII